MPTPNGITIMHAPKLPPVSLWRSVAAMAQWTGSNMPLIHTIEAGERFGS